MGKKRQRNWNAVWEGLKIHAEREEEKKKSKETQEPAAPLSGTSMWQWGTIINEDSLRTLTI
jgi:hypothetical protein